MKPFYEAIAWLVVHIHSGLSHVFGSDSGAAWGLSIVLLTVAMRLVLFPLFVKQIKNQRAMQVLQPKMKELQAKYKNDKEKLNQEMMALWREHGANPLAGCLPLILQIPIFIALFRVLNSIKPGCGKNSPTCQTILGSDFDHHYGISVHLVASAANAKVFGVPIFAAFNSSQETLSKVGAHTTTVKIVTAVMIVLMGASTFFTQRQLMARSKASGVQQTDQMQQTQKIMLYVLPLTFAIFGYRFPMGVLLYWLTTNIWSMGQQAIVIRRMDEKSGAAAATTAAPPTPSGPPPGAKPVRPAPATPAGSGGTAGSSGGAGGGSGPRPGGNRRPAGRNKRNRRRR